MEEFKGFIIYYRDNYRKSEGYVSYDGRIVTTPKKAEIYTSTEAKQIEETYRENYKHIEIEILPVTLIV